MVVGRVGDHGTSGVGEDRSAKFVDAGGREVQPAQVGFEVEEGVVGEQRDGHRRRPPDGRQLAHPLEVGVALGVDQRLDRAPGQDREHDLGEQRRLEVRLGIERLVEPALELARPLVGDRVAAALRALGLLDLVDPDATALLEPTQRRIDLREGDRMVRREVAIDQRFRS